MKKFYGENIDSNELEFLLKATPFSGEPRINFSKKISEEEFFKHIYVSTNNSHDPVEKAMITEFDKKINQIMNTMNNKNAKVDLIHISGYGGCGKTTYMRHLIWELNKNNPMSNCVFDFEGKNLVIPVIEKSISADLFETSQNDETLERMMKDVDNYDFLSFEEYMPQFNIILNHINKNNSANQTVFKEIHNKINIDTISLEDKEKYIGALLLFKFIYILTKMVINNQESIPLVIVFDNVDSISSTFEESFFVVALKNFFNKSNFFFGDNLLNQKSFYGKTISEIVNSFKLMCFLTTRIITINKYKQLEPDLEQIYGWYSLRMPNNYYFPLNIIKRRVEYYNKLEQGVSSNKITELNNLLEFSNSVYKNNIFQRLFNGNIRKSVETICKLANSQNEDIINELIYLCNYQNASNEASRGATGMLISLLFNYFKKNDIYKDKLMLSDCQIDNTLSLSRIILTIIHEKGGNCSLLDLFFSLSPYYPIEKICDTIFNLSEANRDIWRRLVTFDGISIQSISDIKKQGNLFSDGVYDPNEYSLVVICTAGDTYIEHIVPHFEFMLTRHRINDTSYNKNYKPLFHSNSLNHIEDGNSNYEYYFERKIDWVFNDVKDCCKNSTNFSNKILENENLSRKEYVHNTYYNFHFVNRTNNTTDDRQSYESRLIFSHIGYIERYRRYILSLEQLDYNERIYISKILIKYIKKYLSLYENENLCYHSERQDRAYDYLSEMIAKLEKSSYKDFSIKIEFNK